ncbi:hypothetical protein PSY73_23585, partial [Shigella flexneri]|nr:hypothetical protein [Shigella flexneri]
FSHNIKQINSLKNEFICLILWEYASSPTCITFSHNIKQINSLKNEFICLILWEKVMHVGEEAYSPVA